MSLSPLRQNITIPQKSISMSSEFFKWHYHDTKRNETLRALQRGADHLFLVFVGKPGCAICAAQWKALNTAAFTKFMEEHEIVGLKVDDSASHYQALVTGAKLWRNPDNSRINEGPPFLALIKTHGIISDDDTITLSLRKTGVTNVSAWICGSTPKYIPTVNAKNVMAWIEAMEQTDAFKKAFPWLANGQPAKEEPTEEKPAKEELSSKEDESPSDGKKTTSTVTISVSCQYELPVILELSGKTVVKATLGAPVIKNVSDIIKTIVNGGNK